MRRRLDLLALALGVAGLTAPPVTAAPARNSPEAAGFTQLFMSPCGEPYRGKPGDLYPVALWFKQADLNHDGVIDRAEFRADHAGFFDALDGDGNGILEGPELAFYEKQVAPDVYVPDQLGEVTPRGRDGAQLILAQLINEHPEGGHPNDRYDPGQGAKGPGASLDARRPERKQLVGAASYGLLAEVEPVRAADTDLDGRVTKAEFLAAADRRFKLLDKRGDGKLTLDELPMTASQVALARRK